MNLAERDALLRMSATRMLAMLAAGDISSAELVDAHIERIIERDSALNAVVVKRFEQARSEALIADRQRASGGALGALHGLPISLKECFGLAGTAHTFGLPWRASELAEHDDAYTRQLRADGAIVLGKTNVSQCLLYFESDNPVYGRSNNPSNPERSCGGSSGGEAAVIASGGSPLGFGTDIGGSSRIPAAFCGIAGFKPTQGRAPDPGLYSIPFGQQAVPSQIGVLARHVDDIALGLQRISQVHADTVPALRDVQAVDVARLRVGYFLDDGTMSAAPALLRAVREAADVLRAAGADVFEWSPPNANEAVRLYFSLLSADGGDGFRKALRNGAIDPRLRDLSRLASLPRPMRGLVRAALAAAGQKTLSEFLGYFGRRDAGGYWQLVEEQARYRERFADAIERERIDVVLGPPCALPAYRHGAARDVGVGGGYSLLWNLLGYPAGVVPVTRVRADEESSRPPSRDVVEKAAANVERGSAGLPAAVQVAARPWQEHVALAAMRVIEGGVRKLLGIADSWGTQA